MFWNVRAIPKAVIRSGRALEISGRGSDVPPLGL